MNPMHGPGASQQEQSGAVEPSSPPAATTARRRYLAVLFCDLSDSTQLAAALEAEHYAELLAQVRAGASEVVALHGGTIARIQGDGVLAIFGHPVAGEEDGRRATETALDLRDRVRALHPAHVPSRLLPLSVHSGIHCGLVLLEDGDIVLGRFELLGNVPNIAARLAASAGRGEIVVSEESLGPQASFFVTSAPREVHPRGSAEALRVLEVHSRAQTRNRFEARALRGLAPFVGRRDEMRRLESHLNPTELSSGAPPDTPVDVSGDPPNEARQLVAVCGGPGMGKTRLVEEFLGVAAARGFQVHKGYCESYLAAAPYQPFLHMLRGLFGIEHGISNDAAEALVDNALLAIDPRLEVHADQFKRLLSLLPVAQAQHVVAGNAVAALRDLVQVLARQRPVLLFVDDWQWADDASRQALQAIADIRSQVLILVATRDSGDDEFIKRRATMIGLSALAPDETARTIEHLLPGSNPFVTADIHRYAGGNPLFTEELCHCAAAQDPRRDLGVVRRSAAWLDALIESRVERLPRRQAEIARCAAVLGNVFPAWLLEQLTGHGEHDPHVVALAEQDFIFPTDQGGMLRFKHGITRDVIYAAVGWHERRGLHLRVAAAFESQREQGDSTDACEALAYHYGAGGDAARSAHWAELAGDKALAASALDRARTQYGAALAAWDEVGKQEPAAARRWVVVLQKLGIVCVFDPLAVAGSLALFSRGVAIAHELGDSELLARAQYWLAYISYALGRARYAKQHCLAALDLAKGHGEPRFIAQVRATLGQVLTSACDYDAALELLESSIETKRRHAQGGQRQVAMGSAYSLACKGLILGDRGQFDSAHGCFAQALELVAGTNHPVESSVRGWLCAVLQWQGRWQEGVLEAKLAVRIGEQVRSSHLLAISRALLGYCDWVLSGDMQSLKLLEQANAWVESHQGRVFTSLNHGWLADAYVSLGENNAARAQAAQALRRARESDRLGEAMACRAMARLVGLRCESLRAERWLERAMHCAQVRTSPHEIASTQLCRAQIGAALGHRGAARHALDSACTAFEGMQMHWHLAQAQALWRELG